MWYWGIWVVVGLVWFFSFWGFRIGLFMIFGNVWESGLWYGRVVCCSVVSDCCNSGNLLLGWFCYVVVFLLECLVIVGEVVGGGEW